MKSLSSLVGKPSKLPATISTLLPITTNPLKAIIEIEELQETLPEADRLVDEFFGDHLYVRMARMRKGEFLIGAVHKFAHVSILVSGHMTIWTPESGMHDVHGLNVTEVRPGMKRAGYAHTDVVWITAHATEGVSQDLHPTQQEMEELLTTKKFSEFAEFYSQFQLGRGLEGRQRASVWGQGGATGGPPLLPPSGQLALDLASG